jgi:dihydrofolate reductase
MPKVADEFLGAGRSVPGRRSGRWTRVTRKIVLMTSVSVDGYMQGPDRDISWHLVDDELHSHFNAVLREMGAFLEGRVTYELMAGYWPTADADPSAPAPIAEFAAIWRGMPKVVFSRTLERVDDNATIKREVDVAEIRALTAQPGGDLAIGGADLAATFLALGLVDELRLYVHPVVLGAGTPLFPAAGNRMDLRLIENRTFPNGVVLERYEVVAGTAARRLTDRVAAG